MEKILILALVGGKKILILCKIYTPVSNLINPQLIAQLDKQFGNSIDYKDIDILKYEKVTSHFV